MVHRDACLCNVRNECFDADGPLMAVSIRDVMSHLLWRTKYFDSRVGYEILMFTAICA